MRPSSLSLKMKLSSLRNRFMRQADPHELGAGDVPRQHMLSNPSPTPEWPFLLGAAMIAHWQRDFLLPFVCQRGQNAMEALMTA